jgi:uncharacterized glyoxalase superfamily protein PhnB
MIANRSMPRSTVIPELGYDDVGEAADWLCAAFGFTVRLRIATHRVQLNVGDGAVVVTERRQPQGDARGQVDRAHAVMVRVADVDHHSRQAAGAGARIVHPPTTYPYGERQYSVEDPGGHVWTFSQSVADIDPADWGGVAGRL